MRDSDVDVRRPSALERRIRAFDACMASAYAVGEASDGDEVVIAVFAPNLVSTTTIRGHTIGTVEMILAEALAVAAGAAHSRERG